MPIIANRRSSPASVTGKTGEASPLKRKLRSAVLGETTPDSSIELTESSPAKWKSPRRCLINSPQANTPLKETGKEFATKELKLCKSPVRKKLSDCFNDKPTWNPREVQQLNAVKEALHVSSSPSTILCREEEQNRVLEFCKQCIQQEKAGSLYVCGCPGTGKSLSMEKVREALSVWEKEEGFAKPDVISFNCTSLTNTSEIFSKILGNNSLKKKCKGATSPLKTLQTIYCQKQHSSGTKMMLIFADELDYLITRDRAVLHDLFMLTTFPFSRCILIGIANAIDLADRFLPKLQSMNCKPVVITFRSYSKDQIMMILRQRLMALPYVVFQPQALELCARRVAAASGDMRKALWICRSAIDILEFEIRDSVDSLNQSSIDLPLSTNQITANGTKLAKQNNDIVRVDHMALALSKAYRSPVVDTIQSLPQHQQILLCSAVKLFRGGKKDSTIGELNKHYIDFCKWTAIPPVGMVELSSMCRVLADQGLFKLGQSREDKLRKVALKVDETDVTFALQKLPSTVATNRTVDGNVRMLPDKSSGIWIDNVQALSKEFKGGTDLPPPWISPFKLLRHVISSIQAQ